MSFFEWVLVLIPLALAVLKPIQTTYQDDLQVLGYIERSQAYALAFEYDRAIAEIDAALALQPENATLYLERGQRVLLLYEWDRVLADYNRALALDPLLAEAYFQRGILFYSTASWPDAALDFEHYLELEPDGPFSAQARTYLTQLENLLPTP